MAKEKDAVILAHYYTKGEIQEVADFIGDSLALARKAADTEAKIIVMAGVHFMAETCKILSPEKLVLCPDLNAGCSLADSCKAEDLRQYKEEHPGYTVISYVNTTAAVKAYTDMFRLITPQLVCGDFVSETCKDCLDEKVPANMDLIMRGVSRMTAPGVHLVPHTTPDLAAVGQAAGMLRLEDDIWRPDDFAHEMSLVIELGQEPDAPLAIFNSCSHAGLPVIVAEVMAAFPGRAIAAYVGGLHLVHASDETILRVARAVETAGIGQLYTGHCTGNHALELLRTALPGQVILLRPGLLFAL